VRGYDYQAVGPLDANGVPIGGRSAVEAAFEARARITKRIQLAAFADAGAVYSEPFPDFAGDYLVGAGLGVRYLSTLGPIRLDAAVPLEKRPTDRDFQIYISLGQPF
jgi:translocation and assembly module TamA